MRRAIAGLLLVVAAQAETVSFPGDVQELSAPNAFAKLVLVDPGKNAFDDHDYSLRLEYPDGRAEEIVAFTRSVDAAWSPSGNALFVTNNVTANAADCYVFTPGTGAAARLSMTDVVNGGRFPGPAWALQHSAHGAVRCDSWVDGGTLRFVLDGVGDDNPKPFRFVFTYELASGKAKMERVGAKKR